MTTIEIIGALTGLLYLWLEYKADIRLWPVGVLMPLFYIYIFFTGKFYANMGINVYYLVASVYGWIQWKKNVSAGVELPVSHLPKRFILRLVVLGAALFGLIAGVLICYTDSPVPCADAFITALSILAMWMLAHKYVEQWGLWFVANAFAAGIYFYQGLYPTSILFVIYTIVPIFGYKKWKELIDNP
ncbi:MAG: nicotinamide riboside transporter PnuC [Tannerella sp.]|jgi:nicotinamide mononucleotide transporter|nr:nicotinamide riboside transporter PnuC [Tannerella sp.]